MDQLTLTQKLLAETDCPSCSETRLQFDLRCDLGMDECLYTATCLSCQTMFTVARPKEPKALETEVCASCDNQRAAKSMQCNTQSRSCSVVWHCTDCEEDTVPVPA